MTAAAASAPLGEAGLVTVVGSANVDIVLTLERFPQPGETVIGDRLEEVGGGKGANQAMAAARDAEAAFVGCVGQDEAGAALVHGLEQAGVRTEYVLRCTEPTGRAFIQVTPDGENSIVVLALANRRLEPAAVRDALEALRPAVVLAQLEIPLESVEAAADWAEHNAARFLLNPSPIRALAPSLLARCDPLVVNAAEAAAILVDSATGADPDASGVGQLAADVARLTRSVVVTDGSRGAVVGTAEGLVSVQGKPVTAVDTTGAGDEFAGQLAGALARGLDLHRAAELANEAAARLVQVPRSQR